MQLFHFFLIKLWKQIFLSCFGLYTFCVLQASSKDTEHLYAAIHHRLVALRSFAEQEPDAHQVDTESETAFQPLNCDSGDDDDDEELTQVSSTGSGKQKFSWKYAILSGYLFKVMKMGFFSYFFPRQK